ncbi:hypothetical protein CU097_013481 [Rhizopus azygosporus]|nr:hypothetical protein CU097_013481 [Rhizopus azygosporus]
MMTITSFIGLFGAQLEHTGFLNTYNGLHAIILVFELVIISIAYNYRSQILDPYASILWDFFIEHDPQFVMNTEQLLQCCGYQSITDRALPANCSLSLNTNIGCKYSIISLIKRWHQWIILILIFLLILQSTILVLSIVLDIIVERQIREEERYLTLLKQSNHNYWLGHHSNHEGPSTNSGYFGRHRASLHTQKSNNSSTFIPKYGSTPSTSSATFYQVHS